MSLSLSLPLRAVTLSVSCAALWSCVEEEPRADDSDGLAAFDASASATQTADDEEGRSAAQRPAVADLSPSAPEHDASSLRAAPLPTSEAGLAASASAETCTLADTVGDASQALLCSALQWCPKEYRVPVCTSGEAPWPNSSLDEVSVHYIGGLVSGTYFNFRGQRDGQGFNLEVMLRDTERPKQVVALPGAYQTDAGTLRVLPPLLHQCELTGTLIDLPVRLLLERNDTMPRPVYGSEVDVSGRLLIGGYAASFHVTHSCDNAISF